MLSSLHIENIAVIRRADLELSGGFVALTGETGAGKSMIIDSVNLLLGNRVSKEIVRSGEKSAQVSAVFENLSDAVVSSVESLGFAVEDRSLMLQRTLHADGRSQTRLNGQIITQAMQKEVARLLVNIHGQSDSQKLLQKSTHRELLDAYALPEAALAEYREAYHELKACMQKAAALKRDASEKLRLCEMLKYQIEDIDAMKLREGEEERLLKERDRLAHLEQINRQVRLIRRALRDSEKGNAYDLVRRSQAAFDSLEGLIDGVDALNERLSAVLSELDDIAESVLAYADDDQEDPTARIDRIEERLDGISKLKRKYGDDVASVLAFRANAARQLEELELSDESLADLENRIKVLTKKAKEQARLLHEKRKIAAAEIEKSVTDALAFLDMPKVRFAVALEACELCEDGADDIEFLIATNPGEPLLPMIKIASGGELSRIMLALRSVLNDRDGADTVIFDEIDSGVSGKTSRKIGIKLMQTAQKGAQVICVTHSAQIASLADAHYRISKEEREGRAETDVTLLSDDGRIEEIARILGGIRITTAQRDAAREMIEEYR